MPGIVYLAVVDGRENFVKIGMTEGDVHERMRQLTDAPNSLGRHKPAYFRRVDNPAEIEGKLHESFHFCREAGTEYFRVHWQAVKVALEHYPESPLPTPGNEPPQNNNGDDAFIAAIRGGDLATVRRLIAAGMDMNLGARYGWRNFPNNQHTHGNLYIGDLLALNPVLLMGGQGQPIVKALMLAFICQNPGINNTPIFRHLGIQTKNINGGNNDWYAWQILQNLKAEGKIENKGATGTPQWHAVENAAANNPPPQRASAPNALSQTPRLPDGIILEFNPDGSVTWRPANDSE